VFDRLPGGRGARRTGWCPGCSAGIAGLVLRVLNYNPDTKTTAGSLNPQSWSAVKSQALGDAIPEGKTIMKHDEEN